MLDPVAQPTIPRRPKKQSQIRTSENLDEESLDKLVSDTEDGHLNISQTLKSEDENEKVPIIPKRPERKKAEPSGLSTPVIPRRPVKSQSTNVDVLSSSEITDIDNESEANKNPNDDSKILHEVTDNTIESSESSKVDSDLENNSLVDSRTHKALDKFIEADTKRSSILVKNNSCGSPDEHLEPILQENNKTDLANAASKNVRDPSLQSQVDNEFIDDNLSEKIDFKELRDILNIQEKDEKYSYSPKSVLETKLGDISPESEIAMEEEDDDEEEHEEGEEDKKFVQNVSVGDSSGEKFKPGSDISEQVNKKDIDNELNDSNKEKSLQTFSESERLNTRNEAVDQDSEKEIDNKLKSSEINTGEDGEHPKHLPQIPRRPKKVKTAQSEPNSTLSLDDISHKANTTSQVSQDVEKENADEKDEPLTSKSGSDKSESIEQEKLSNKPVAPPKPKKLSSKIAAFQQMFNQENLPLQGVPGPMPSSSPRTHLKIPENKETRSRLSNDKMKFAESLQGMMGKGIALPGMVNPNFNQNISDTTKDPEPTNEVKILNVKKGIAKGPRGKKLPKSLKTPVNLEITSRFNSTVLTIWELNFQLDKVHDKSRSEESTHDNTQNQTDDEKPDKAESSEYILRSTEEQTDEKDDHDVQLSSSDNSATSELNDEGEFSTPHNVTFETVKASASVNEKNIGGKSTNIENPRATIISTSEGDTSKICLSQELDLSDTELKYIEESQVEEELKDVNNFEN